MRKLFIIAAMALSLFAVLLKKRWKKQAGCKALPESEHQRHNESWS